MTWYDWDFRSFTWGNVKVMEIVETPEETNLRGYGAFMCPLGRVCSFFVSTTMVRYHLSLSTIPISVVVCS